MKLDKEIKESDYSAKKKYLKKASIYIKCLRLNETVKKIREYDEIKLYSRDIVGYSTYMHTINDDITVELRTNFGYGSAAYFDNVEHVGIMNDNWDFGCFWSKISAQMGIGTSGPHQVWLLMWLQYVMSMYRRGEKDYLLSFSMPSCEGI